MKKKNPLYCASDIGKILKLKNINSSLLNNYDNIQNVIQMVENSQYVLLPIQDYID